MSDVSASNAHAPPPLSSEGGATEAAPPPQLPPPAPFGTSSSGSNNKPMSSTSSRTELRRVVSERRSSLTLREQDFLEELIVTGQDVEVQVAMETILTDESLFFPDDDPPSSDLEDGSSLTKQNNLKQRPNMLKRSSSLGSQRRLQVLEDKKRQESSTDKLWKAHETGLSLTKEASQRSLLVREQSFSKGRRQRQSRQSSGGGGVFRSPVATTSRSSLLQRSQSLQKLPAKSSALLSSPIPKPPLPRRSSSIATPTAASPLPPLGRARRSKSASSQHQFHRSASDTIRYQAVPEDQEDVILEVVTTTPVRHTPGRISSLANMRSDSISTLGSEASFPSLHPGAPVRADSMGSIPSLHHGVPLQIESEEEDDSRSTRTVPSLHPAQPLLEDNDTTSSAVGTNRSIPSLHHGTQLRDEDDASISSNAHSVSAIHARQQLLQQYNAPSDSVAQVWTSQQQQQPIPTSTTKPTVLMRRASVNSYQGEGIEVEELSNSNDPAGRLPMMGQSILDSTSTIPTSLSWDDQYSAIFRTEQDENKDDDEFSTGAFLDIRQTKSHDEDLAKLFLGSSAHLLVLKDNTTNSEMNELMSESLMDDVSDSTSFFEDAAAQENPYDGAWNVLQDDYVNGYGGGGTLGFSILGTSGSDEECKPHVLSPPLMESLQAFLPLTKSGENMLLKYSLVRDGASLHSFLRMARGTKYSILAVETVDGEVFGAFCGQAWRKNWNYFGTPESFLWKMRRSRLEGATEKVSIIEQAQMESEIDVYPYTGENRYIQLCTHDRIAVGGGSPTVTEKKEEDDAVAMDNLPKDHEWGFGLSIEGDLLYGTSSPCVTYGSPSLSTVHKDGSAFEIVNLELWTLTPCQTLEEAEKMELGRLFLDRSSQ